MYWNRSSIEAEQRSIAVKRHEGATPQELLEEIVRLRCALYPFATALGSLDELAPRGVMATSALFPADLGEGTDAGKLAVYDDEKKDFRYVDADSGSLHEQEYEQRESITVENGADGCRRMADDVCILQVHSYWTGAYADCGQVTMADVRMAVAAIRGTVIPGTTVLGESRTPIGNGP